MGCASLYSLEIVKFDQMSQLAVVSCWLLDRVSTTAGPVQLFFRVSL